MRAPSPMVLALRRYKPGVKVAAALALFAEHLWVPRHIVRVGTPFEKAGITLLVKRGAVVLFRTGNDGWVYRPNVTTAEDGELWWDLIEAVVA